MKLADCLSTARPSSEAEAEFRASYFDLCQGRLFPDVMRRVNPNIILIDYSRPTYLTSWMRYILELYGPIDPRWDIIQGGIHYADISRPECRWHIAKAIALHLKQFKVDGIQVDTPFETPLDHWYVVELCDQIAKEIAPAIMIPNFGDADTWAGRTSPAKALSAVSDWHFVQVWMDINHFTLPMWVNRVETTSRMLKWKKRLVLGIYDEGGIGEKKAADAMRHSDDSIFSHYCNSLAEKPNIRDWQVNGEL